MPIYDYQCNECGNRFEKMQPITADPIKECPRCGKPGVRRIFHPVGVIFKGSGWYINDSRKSSGSDTNTNTGSSSDSSKTADNSTSSAKTEAKSDASTGSSDTSSSSSSSGSGE